MLMSTRSPGAISKLLSSCHAQMGIFSLAKLPLVWLEKIIDHALPSVK